MKKMLCAATAAVTMAAAMMAGAVAVPTAEAKDFVEFPYSYQGEWCGIDDDPAKGSITYARRACDNPAGQVFIAADTYSERDATCRMISAVGLNRAITNDAPFDARLKCRVRKGGAGDYEATWHLVFNRNKTPEELTIVDKR